MGVENRRRCVGVSEREVCVFTRRRVQIQAMNKLATDALFYEKVVAMGRGIIPMNVESIRVGAWWVTVRAWAVTAHPSRLPRPASPLPPNASSSRLRRRSSES